MPRRLLVAVIVVAVVGLISAPAFLSSYWLSVLTEALIFALAAASLDLLFGYTGMVSLGHAAFFGVAGYTVGLGMTRYGMGAPAAAMAGIAVAMAVGASFGAVAARARGLYFLVITLAFGQVMWGVAVKWTDFTGGYNGIPRIGRPVVATIPMTTTTRFYYLVAVVVALCLVALWMLVRSRVGLSLEGVRSNEPRMRLLGYRAMLYRWMAFTVAAGFGAVAGVLNAFHNQYVGPGSLVWTLSALLVLMVMLGGARTLWGAAAGGAALVFLRTIISGMTGRWVTVLGLLYVVTVLIAPDGWLRFAARQLRRGDGHGTQTPEQERMPA